MGLIEDIKKNKASYLMIAPYMLLFTIFTLIPVLSSIFLSFTNYNMLQPPKWVGWANYIRLFLNDKIFLKVLRNTLIFAFLTGPLSYFMSFFLAWFISEFNPKLRAFLTLVFYSPSLAGNVFFIWSFIFSGDVYGLINGWAMKLGIINEPINWLQDPNYILWVIIIVQLWLSMGAGFLAFVAGFQNLDRELFEAGAIDGIRNRFQELWYITIPQMAPQLMFGAVMQIGASFGVSTVVMALGGLPTREYSADTVVTYLIDYGTVRFEMGYASAIAVILFIAMLLTNKVIASVLRRYSFD
ncbi:binding-protein-dependent transport systems inner membrane component [Caldicellulosiruptor saccharolyticus DSM 8903]|uniref:Binding-protein-dependent transport systems inner membrane component n=1 Tax=Caldicellulosiruptor saccharolyticus (strain ATCC 43494 / DSM 8903 / Tp8T 6331) TaxID=351627 RepID=A4XM60_CALS8|nr:sugar ABC transporter permease [Caldicellulosiruptor saccharolyticus]ABP67995.1 binding-protein-dependent transport systems inner membrane component [Caldicellulosiruptor saccharolyticus DSM 8903]